MYMRGNDKGAFGVPWTFGSNEKKEEKHRGCFSGDFCGSGSQWPASKEMEFMMRVAVSTQDASPAG